MSLTHGNVCIPNRFSASAPELSSTSSTEDVVVTPSNLQSHSVSQSEESLPRPPLIFVSSSTSSENKSKSSVDDKETSLRIDRRFLTTSQRDNSIQGASSNSVTAPTPMMNSNPDVAIINSPHSQPQPEQRSDPGEQNSARRMEEIVVLHEALGQRLQELRRTLSRHQRRAQGMTLRGCWNAFRGFFGYGPEGTNARKQLVSLIVKLGFGLIQIFVIIVVLVLAGVHKSPVDHTVNEWQACNRPLGIWSVVWSVRVVMGCFVAIWMYQHRSTRLLDLRSQRHNTPAEVNDTQPNVSPDGIDRPSTPNDFTDRAQGNVNTNNDNTPPLQHRNNSPVARMGSALSLVSTIWFIIAHAFLYTSVKTCRLSAPHLWWLTFGLVCIGYIVVVELIAVVLLIFIIGPLLMLSINLVLRCLGREPLRLTSSQPSVGKLSLKAVEAIPLVLYIPAPMDKNPEESPQAENDVSVSKPEAVHIHSYPPQRDCPSPSSLRSTGTRVQSRRSKRWFTFRRLSSKKVVEHTSKELSSGDTYEDKWEKGEYPFVKLEENRAVCAICLCDFEEPKRVRYSIGSMPPLDQEEKEIGTGATAESPSTDSEDGALRLADAGDGAQPLRLLDCAHAFHKTCIDPWLTEVSGRCPVCQRPVEPKDSSKKNQRRTR